MSDRSLFLRAGLATCIVAAAAVATLLSPARKVQADSNFFVLTPSTPFLQNWSNTGMITIDDDWSGVPSITGYRGDDPAGVPGTDPTTVLADYSGIVDVNANRNDPDTFAPGGVTEFDGIADPVVGLQGSDTADFPHLEIRLNTVACPVTSKLSVGFIVRDLDGSADDAVQQTALHYRVGPTGNYTNHQTGFVADATNPNTATRISAVSSSLPDDAKGVTQLYVRIMTANAIGTDEWVGIDDISISCASPTAAPASIAGRVTTSDGRGVSKAMVVVSGGELSSPRYAMTNAFGLYSFPELTSGETYVVMVVAKGHQFDPPTRVIQLSDSLADVDFVASAAARGRK